MDFFKNHFIKIKSIFLVLYKKTVAMEKINFRVTQIYQNFPLTLI